MSTLSDYIDAIRTWIDEGLAARSEFAADCPAELRAAMRYSLLAPGKRLRPMLTVLAAEACGGSRQAALPAACAVEMVHAYSLIHDDLPAMDDDDLRRGRPTCHKRFGEAMAILAGDALLARAFEVLAKETEPAETAVRCCAALGEAAGPCRLVGGQADDVLGRLSNADQTVLESIHRRKTGAMIAVAIRLGGMVAQASWQQAAALDEYGWRLGLAFQITDDLLDTCGNEQTMGKRARKDADHGKVTFPTLLGVAASRERAQQLVDEACAALEPLGPGGERLEAVARGVLERNR